MMENNTEAQTDNDVTDSNEETNSSEVIQKNFAKFWSHFNSEKKTTDGDLDPFSARKVRQEFVPKTTIHASDKPFCFAIPPSENNAFSQKITNHTQDSLQDPSIFKFQCENHEVSSFTSGISGLAIDTKVNKDEINDKLICNFPPADQNGGLVPSLLHGHKQQSPVKTDSRKRTGKNPRCKRSTSGLKVIPRLKTKYNQTIKDQAEVDKDGLPIKTTFVLSYLIRQKNYKLLESVILEEKDRLKILERKNAILDKSPADIESLSDEEVQHLRDSKLMTSFEIELDMAIKYVVSVGDMFALELLHRLDVIDLGHDPLESIVLNSGNTKVVEFLKEQGRVFGDQSLHAAVAAGKPDVLKLLLNTNCNVNIAKGRKKRTPLHVAVILNHPECADLLIAAGANVNAAISGEKTTLLHYAAAAGSKRMVTTLRDKGACNNTKARHENGLHELKPWMIAGMHGHFDLMNYLRQSDSVDEPIGYTSTLLHLAAREQQNNLVDVLLELGSDVNKRDKDNCTPAFYSCKDKLNQSLLNMFIEAGADCNVIDNDCKSLLCYVLGDRSYDFEEIHETCDNMVKRGAKVNDPAMSYHPLILHNVDDVERAAWLLEMGANPNCRAQNGTTAISAVANMRYPLDIIPCLELLYDYNIDIHLTGLSNYGFEVPLRRLFMSTDVLPVIRMLLERECVLDGVELWLTPSLTEQIGQRGKEWQQVLEAIRYLSSNPRSLKALTRLAILSAIGPGLIEPMAKKLGLPAQLAGYMKWEVYVSTLSSRNIPWLSHM